ncbi:MAG: endonuclease V [Planctomycetota bacterium]|nr:MAG: endonuclease V [Planctomycetota bacterium]
MQTKKLHIWDLSYQEAIALQKCLSKEVQLVQLQGKPKAVAGIDCAFSKDKQRIIAAAVILSKPDTQKGLWEPIEPSDFEVVEKATAIQKVTFPYIPGLLSFREAPACLAAVEKLKIEPDVFIIDGQGIAHPRRFGLAAHLGLFFDKPTIGCAKSRLTGTFEEPPPEKGKYTLLLDEPTQETIGAVVRTRSNVEPVFVSVGNKCTLKDAVEITLTYTTKYRLPEPTRLAHQVVTKAKSTA